MFPRPRPPLPLPVPVPPGSAPLGAASPGFIGDGRALSCPRPRGGPGDTRRDREPRAERRHFGTGFVPVGGRVSPPGARVSSWPPRPPPSSPHRPQRCRPHPRTSMAHVSPCAPPSIHIPLGDLGATVPRCPEPPRPQRPPGMLTPNLCFPISVPAPGMLQGLLPAQPYAEMWGEKGRNTARTQPPALLPSHPQLSQGKPQQAYTKKSLNAKECFFAFNSLFWYIHSQPLPGGAGEGSPNEELPPTPTSAMGLCWCRQHHRWAIRSSNEKLQVSHPSTCSEAVSSAAGRAPT